MTPKWIAAAIAMLCALGATGTTAHAVEKPKGAPALLEFLDRRADERAAVPAAMREARRDLADAIGGLSDVRTDRATGGLSFVARTDAPLTGPSSRAPDEIVFSFLERHAEAYGIDADDLATLRLVARDESPDGMTHLRYNQVLRGIESYDSGLIAHVTRDGRLISTSASPLPGARLATTRPRLGALAALGAARRSARGASLPPQITGVLPGRSRATTFATGERARLRWVATASGARLAWDVISDGTDGHMYATLVDASTGEVVVRQDLTHHLGEADYFRRDPDATPGQTRITMSPAWYDDHADGTRLWGEFARTQINPADAYEQVPASAGAPSSPDWLYAPSHDFPGALDCPPSGCTWNKDVAGSHATNRFQAATNTHVLVSRFHDHLEKAPIGFDEAAGNFERTNTSGDGKGNDPVLALINRGADKGVRNNATMATPPDGSSPVMSMFVFTPRNTNSADSADVVYHEYTHGLTARMTTNTSGHGSLYASFQGRQMGEAYSDFYGMDLLVAEGDASDTSAPGELELGAHLISGGIRSKPIDCPVAPEGIPACDKKSAQDLAGGHTYGDLARINHGGFPHGGSEVWAQTLWDIRSSSIPRDDVLALITGGLRLAPRAPSMLDMRDAILRQAMAMRSAPGASDDYYPQLWPLFAARGMGPSASTPDASSTQPTESFELPEQLAIRSTRITDPYPLGDNDGWIEAGEQIEVRQDVEGISAEDLDGVTGTLSSTSAAVTVGPPVAWPTLGHGRRAVNAVPMTATLARETCHQTVPLTVTTTASRSSAITTRTFDVLPLQDTNVVTGNDTGQTTSESTFHVSSGGTVSDIDILVPRLDHEYVQDLRLEISHGGTTVLLWEGNLDRFRQGPRAGIVDLVFDDEAEARAPRGVFPLTGRWQAVDPLSAFDGMDASGDWTLRVIDRVRFFSGTLRRWGLGSAAVPCPVPSIPVSTTGSADAVAATAATLTGQVNPAGRATKARIAYGTTTGYGSLTAVQDVGAGDDPVDVSARVTGLKPNTSYHYRVEALRESGAVATTGADRTFRTPAAISEVAIDSSASPAVHGQEVTFTALVVSEAEDAGTPTGTVTFSLDGTPIMSCSERALDDSGAASCTTAFDHTGSSRLITASYSGDGAFTASRGSLEQVVERARTTLELSGPARTPVTGETFAVVARPAVVAPGGGRLDGAVEFLVDGRPATGCERIALSDQGDARCDLVLDGGRAYLVEARYASPTAYEPSDSRLDQTVDPAQTETTLTSSANPSVSGQSVTYTAEVAVRAPGSGRPAGRVHFPGLAGCEAVALDADARATCTTTYAGTAGAPHAVIAAYVNETRLAASTGSLVQRVERAATTIGAVTSSASPATVGSLVLLRTSVTPVEPGAGAPTGNVEFLVDGAVVGTAEPDPQGAVALAYRPPVVGRHAITARYVGDADFGPATGTDALEQLVTYRVVSENKRPAIQTGSTYVMRLSLADALGANLSAASREVVVERVRPDRGALAVAPGTAFTFHSDDEPDDHPHYSLKFRTVGLAPGTYELDLRVTDDPVVHTVKFTVR